MTLAATLKEYIQACFTGLWIESHEHEDALAEIAALCRAESWRLAIWDIEHGLRTAADTSSPSDSAATDPLAAVRALGSFATPEGAALLVLVNFHRFLQSAEIIQALQRQITAGKQQRTFVVILAPVVQLPPELEKQFLVVEHDLPGREQLATIARGLAVEPGELPEGAAFEAVLDASAGLTRYEAEGALSLSLVRHGELRPATLIELKAQMLKKSGLLTLHEGRERFADLGGLAALKSFCGQALRRDAQRSPLARPRGVLLLSPPGCGKSQFAKSLGNETGRPTLTLDIGSLLGSLVGQTEHQTRRALQIADAMAPCVLFCDELEKALSGVAGSGQTDSGVSARLFGALLTWLNDHESDVFVVATCNDISRLPPEFARAERFDGVFFVDLPDRRQKDLIWRLYLDKFGLSGRDEAFRRQPADADWTGAEIRACCRLAAMLDIPLTTAAEQVVPVAVTAAESVDKLRQWAHGRCLSADEPGTYHYSSRSPLKPSRRIRRDPSQN